ncbi:hypothetical protein JHN55_25300 [Streptomyces sp. MBT56]|uniref:hypothetical protein n=1 Tax=unclassified Streptomyces TaxID=2593676 RepID=UPI00190C5977|nr:MULTISPECIES: hypothetical protein [unclassified Streptomyces]MBK3559782.1 hypothetical protein [Streptomyces sp. MBT56]MBK3601276.1 hypothetical protein [Streptomyces sp. MBT54]MBK3615277.1 hypothetical protein [Streptomyces sp. MBT98]
MGDLLPFVNGEMARTRRGIKKELLKLDGLHAFNDQAADYLLDLNRHRRARVQMAPEIEPMLNELLVAFHADALRLQSRMLREF